MAHLQYMPGDQRLVDQLVFELKSKGIFDQFRKDCIADVDTRPAYQNLRQRVESSVTTFLSRQKWKPDLNKNQLREKLRKHILDGNYLDQGVERIVDQVVNPKVASVFIPQVEELVCNYLGIKINKTTPSAETSNGKREDLLPTDLEAVSPGSVKSNDEKDDLMDICSTDNTAESKMEIDEDSKPKLEIKDENSEEKDETQLSGISDLTSHSSDSIEINIPLPADIDPQNIPPPDTSPPKIALDQIKPPKVSDIPLPDAPMPEDINVSAAGSYFKPVELCSEEDSSSNSSDLRRNMSPLTPVRNFDDENSCDAKQGFDDAIEVKSEDKKDEVVSSFNFNIDLKSSENSNTKIEKKEALAFEIENQSKIKTPLYEESSNSNNLQIDYESDANSKTNQDSKPEPDQSSQDVKKEKSDDKRSHKSSHRSRDSNRQSSSSKDRRSESKQSSSRDKRDEKKSRDDHSSSKSKSSHRDRSKDRNDKTSRDSSKHRQSSSYKGSSKDSKSHRSSSSGRRHSSSKHSDDKKSSSSSNNRERGDKSSSRDHKSSKDSKSSHRSDKDRKSSSSRSKNEKDKDKKDKKDIDDHYSLSGRGNNNRRSTDRDSNDGNSSSSKGSNNQTNPKTAEAKKEKGESSKSGSTTSSSGASPSDKDNAANDKITNSKDVTQSKPIVRVETHLEMPLANHSPVRFMPEVVLKKPKFASNMEEARKMMKMRKFLDEEQRRMNQEAALLLEFQANVRPSLSQVYSNISGPELEFACVNNVSEANDDEVVEQTVEVTEVVPYEDEFVEIDPQYVESIAEIQKEVDNITNDRDSEGETQGGNAENKTNTELFEVTIVTDDDMSDMEGDIPEMHHYMNQNDINDIIGVPSTDEVARNDHSELHYFNQQERYNAELYRDQYSKFLKSYTEEFTRKLFLVNCDTYYENVFRDASQSLGDYTIVTYRRNGHNLLKATKNIDFSNKEITLPMGSADIKSPLNSAAQSPFLSPIKSECSFELSSDYDAKLEDMVNNTSRQQIMEIILGGIIGDASPSKMPKIDICNESNIERSSKRKYTEIESNFNNNRQVLTQNKIRKISCSDQITSTTQDTDDMTSNHRNNTSTNTARSKYLGKAKRVGLPKPKRSLHSNSPSSDKSVENYEQNDATELVNGKIKTPRNKVQRYDTSDLYKPKQHFLSRRNNIS